MTESETADEAVRAIRRSPALVEEAKAVAPRLDARQAPMLAPDVVGLLVELVPIYNLRDRGKEQWKKFWEAYIRALAPLPREALEAAIVDWNQTGDGYFPKPPDLFKRAQTYANQIRLAAWRARKAAESDAKSPVEHRRDLTPEEIAERKALTRELFHTDAEGHIIALKRPDGAGPAPGMDAPKPRPLHERQEEAERLRRLADAPEPEAPAEPLPVTEDPPEAI